MDLVVASVHPTENKGEVDNTYNQYTRRYKIAHGDLIIASVRSVEYLIQQAGSIYSQHKHR